MASGKSRRAALATGLGIGGLIALPKPGLAQDPAPPKPEAPPAEPKPDDAKAEGAKPGVHLSIGVVDVEALLKDSRKMQAANEQFKADAAGRQRDLLKIVEKGKEMSEDLGRLTPGTPDHDRLKGKLEQLGAQLEAEKQKAKQEFSAREAGVLGSLYQEIEKHVEAVARSRGLQLVLRLSNTPIDSKNGGSVMSALSRAVVFADPKLDITAEVRDRLNRR